MPVWPPNGFWAARFERMTTDLPRVVACMPAWNGEAFIARTLDSLASQSYLNLEILISDDASSDRTGTICELFARARANVRYIRQATNLGWIANVNALLAQAEGDYLFFAFHDDPLEPTYVERLVNALEGNSRAVLDYTDVDIGDRIAVCDILDGVSDRWERARRIARRTGDWWVPNRGLFRNHAATGAGGMQRHLAGEFMADWPWLLRLSLLGEFVRVPEPLVHKVWLKTGLSLIWRHSLAQRAGVTLACAQAIRHARFPLDRELALYRELLLGPLRRRWWQMRAERG